MSTGGVSPVPDQVAPLRYVDILTDPRISGPHRRVQALAGGMKAAGHEPTVLLPRGSSPEGEFSRELAQIGVDVRYNSRLMQVRTPSPRTLLHNARWTANTARVLAGPLVPDAGRYDCAVVNGMLNAWLCIHPSLRATRIVLIVNDTLVPRAVFRSFLRLLPSRVRCVFQAPSIRNYYLPNEAHFESTSAWVDSPHFMPPGVDLTLFAPRPARAPGAEWRLGTLCQVSRRKGVEDGIMCAAQIARRYPDRQIRYSVAGEMLATQERYIMMLRRLASTVPANCRVEFLGFVNREGAADFLRSLDCLIVPSRSESFPQVVVQAQATGTPVVAYAIPGIVDQIVDRESGLLAVPFDASELSNAVERALVDPELASRITAAGQLNAQRNFSLSRNVTKFVEIAHELRPVTRRGGERA